MRRRAAAQAQETGRDDVVASRAGYRAAGWVTIGVASAATTMGLVGLIFLQGSCSDSGCAGNSWGWSAAGAIITAVSLPVGIVLVLQHDEHVSRVTLGSLPVPAGGGASLSLRF